MYAEVPDHLECNDARQGSIQAEGHTLRQIGFPLMVVLLLTFKTVAARFVSPFLFFELFSLYSLNDKTYYVDYKTT